MFDRITVLVPLPGYPAEAPQDGFWTTDLDSNETMFIISEEGRLLGELWHLEPVPAEEQEFGEDLNCLLKASGETKKVVDGLIRREFNGLVRFSRYYNDCLYEYEVEFSGGMLGKITPCTRGGAL
ncbi:MAG TPA: hypothetical protein DCR97_13635 [Deltaproteobacteria bacterium]|nr:hypothetical protein [Deltaproteobacteria bacterium]